MGCGTTDLQDEGIVMCDCIDPWPLYLFGLMMGGPKAVANFRHFPHTLGIMAKIRDGFAGAVNPDGTVSKPLGEKDQSLIARGAEISGRILRRAGCDPASIVSTRPGALTRVAPRASAMCSTPISRLAFPPVRVRRERHPRAVRHAPGADAHGIGKAAGG